MTPSLDAAVCMWYQLIHELRKMTRTMMASSDGGISDFCVEFDGLLVREPPLPDARLLQNHAFTFVGLSDPGA